MKLVILAEIRNSAVRIAIRLALGEFLLRGPQNNIMELESRVAWSTVITELENEGYIMVHPEEYATVCELAPTAVFDRLEQEGNLFALSYAARGETVTVVPLPEQEEREELGPLPE